MSVINQKKCSYRGAKNLAQSLNIVTKPIFQKRGFAENRIITDWNFIVGEQIGNSCTPKKLSFARDKKVDGTLYLEVYDSGIAMEMAYMEPIVIEKIASYFGYKAITKLKIVQRPGGQPNIKGKKEVLERHISEDKQRVLNEFLSDIDDVELKEALSNLGNNVMADM